MEDEDKEYDDNTARALLKRYKYDPDDVNKDSYGLTPLTFFCCEGNFKMVQYLLSRGADCRKADSDGWFPLLWAAAYGHLEIVRFLSHDCGTPDDIRRVTSEGYSPLRIAVIRGQFRVVWWLLLIGALAPRDDIDCGGIDDMVMRRDLCQSRIWRADRRLPILSWVRDAVAFHDHDNVNLFLTGTIVPTSSFRRHPNNPYATRSKRMKVAPSPLVLLKGKAGILEVIAHYVAGTPRQRRTLRQLLILLPAFIEDVPFVEVEDEDEDEDE